MTSTSSKAKFGATKFDLLTLEEIQSISTIHWKGLINGSHQSCNKCDSMLGKVIQGKSACVTDGELLKKLALKRTIEIIEKLKQL